MDKTTGQDLLDFLDYAADKGLMEANTAASQKTAVQKVLGMDRELSEIDVAGLDLDQLLRRFETKFKSDYTPGSLNTYGSRVRGAVADFLAWSHDPAGWKPSRRAPRATSNGKSKIQEKTTVDDEKAPPPPAFEQKGGRLVDYPFPLRDGLMVRLHLPTDLKRSEVRRLLAYMNSLAVDSEEGGNG